MAADGALDLSKPVGEGMVMSSPASSLSPELDPDPVPEVERSESVSSDGHDTDSSTTTTVKAIAGPLPSSHLPTITSAMKSPSVDTCTSDSVPTTTSTRPFKMYPFEPVPGVYSQLAAAANATPSLPSAAGYLNPFAAVTGSPMPFGLFDSAISLSSPIGQYLAQRKRRAEAAQSNSADQANTPNLDSGSTPVKTESDTSSLGNVSDDPSSEPPSPKLARVGADEIRDASYWERRRKNNEAAKRSRDSRRAKEEEIALRAAFLEQENLKLRAQVAILKNETAKLHYMLYNRV